MENLQFLDCKKQKKGGTSKGGTALENRRTLAARKKYRAEEGLRYGAEILPAVHPNLFLMENEFRLQDWFPYVFSKPFSAAPLRAGICAYLRQWCRKVPAE